MAMRPPFCIQGWFIAAALVFQMAIPDGNV